MNGKKLKREKKNLGGMILMWIFWETEKWSFKRQPIKE
jgi:hypothetical protein